MNAKARTLLPVLAFGAIWLVAKSHAAAAPVPAEGMVSIEVLQALRTSAERVAFRMLGDLWVRAALDKRFESVDSVGPALRRLFDADMGTAESKEEQLIFALRYNRLVHRFALSEYWYRDTGRIPDSDYQPRAHYFMRDAAIQVFKAHRGLETNRPTLNLKNDFVEPEFSARTLAIDVLSALVCVPRWFSPHSNLQADDGIVPFTPEVAWSLETFPGVLGPRPDDELVRLLGSRCETASSNLALACKVFQAGAKGGSLDRLFECLNLRLRSELDFGQNPTDHLKAHERALTIAKWVEGANEKRFRAGQISEADFELSRFHRLDHQIGMLRAKARVEGESKKPGGERK